MRDKAYEYLNKDRLHHIDMLETLNRGVAELKYADEDGVLILSESCGAYLISTESETLMNYFCGMMVSPVLITAHQTRFLPLLNERFGFNKNNECFLCAALQPSLLENKIPNGIELRALTVSDIDFVLANYKYIPYREYIEDRINAGMIGAFCGNEPVGFIGEHDDGSMGMLEVLPEYRRRGIAYSLEAALINRLRQQGKIPYAQVFTTNIDSRRLQEKLGMSVSDKPLIWLFNE